MINNDEIAREIIESRISNINIDTIEYSILSKVLTLMGDYSFVNNQTYPRPSHPKEEKRKDAYFTLIAIILSLRTTLENEQKAVNLFLAKYKSIDDVLKSNINEIADTIKCAGMPLKKAKTILELSNVIKNKYSGDINTIVCDDINETRNRLLNLPGVGEKSADCMLELAFDLPSIVIDINMFRVISRLFLKDKNMSFNNSKDILRVKDFLENNLKKDYKLFQIVHTIYLLHGKYICKSKPMCLNCKLKNNCNYYIDIY